jgi:YceI-like domain
VFKRGGWMGAVLLLVACGAPKVQPEHGAAAALTAPAPAPGAGVFRIDPSQSEVRLLVYRAGAMARLGHNHVIVNRSLEGWVKFSGNVATAAFALRVPVADFVIDDAGMRGEEGADFSAAVPDDARAGTRHNMLGDALLDAQHFAAITIGSVSVQPAGVGVADAGTPGGGVPLSATLAVSVAGHSSTLVVPFLLDAAAGRVSGSGSVVVRQSALGLTPFSVMLGALQVQDEMTIKFTLVAVATT